MEEFISNYYSSVTTCLALSRAAYAKDEQSCLKILNEQLKNMSHGIEHIQLAKESKVPYMIAYKPHTDEFYVAFRGTENLHSLLPSLLCAGVPNDFQGRVHAGYAQQAKLIPLNPFTRLLNSNSACKLIFTGHSLGGAIAAMVTSNILFDEQSIGNHERISCITFGAPFFTDENCAAYLNDRFPNQFHFYINHSDPIPFAFCFVHDCFQKLSSHEDLQICIRWLSSLLGVQQTALVSEDQSYIKSLISNMPASQLSEATEAFKRTTHCLYSIFSALKIAVSKYQLFGKCYHIVTDKQISMSVNQQNDSSGDFTQSDTNTTTSNTSTARITIKQMENVKLHIKWLELTPELLINSLIRFYQDHGIRNYISELHTHFIFKYGLGLNITRALVQSMSNSTPLYQNLPLAQFLPTNDPNRWSHDTDTEYNQSDIDMHYWSVISTDYPKDRESNISFQFRGPKVCFFLQLQYCEQKGVTDVLQLEWCDAVRHSSSDEDIVVFEIDKIRMGTKRNMLYRCIHHFGYLDLSKIIDPSKFTSSNGLIGRKQQVANFHLVELYVAALSYMIFTHQSTEETIVAQPLTTTSYTTTNQDRRKKIQDGLLLCEEIILVNRKELEKNLLDPSRKETQIFKDEVVKIRKAGARFVETKQSNENNPNVEVEIETSDFRLCSLKAQLDTLSSTSSSQDIITKATPTLVAMSLTIADKLKLQTFTNPSLIAAGCGAGAGGAIMYTIKLLGGDMILAVVLGMLLFAGVGYGIYRSLSSVIDQEYFKMLEYIAKSMGVPMHKTRQHPYWLEKAIHEIYKKEMALFTDEHILSEWNTKYFQHHELSKISDKQRRLNWLNRVKCVNAHFILREEMSTMLSVGLVGVGKVGKSMLAHKMFAFPTRSGVDRTKDITIYPVSDHFQMIDLPHLTSKDDTSKYSFTRSYTMMNVIIVVLDAQQQGDDEQGEGHVLRTVRQLSAEGVDVLYCFNKSDLLVKNYEKGDQSASSILSDDETDNEDEQKKKPGPIWTKEITEMKIKEFANRYKKYGLHPDQCRLTYFELEETNEKERKTMKKNLKSVGILNGADIRDIWLKNFLEDNGFDKEPIDKIMKFRYKN